VDSGDWFAMEFTSPDRTKGWATVVRLSDIRWGKTGPDAYRLTPKGLDPKRSYAVTFDNRGATEVIPGALLAGEGLLIRPPASPRSELLLFEAT
jgi:hypothetical protein